MTDRICLDEKYSTTKLVTKEKPEIVNKLVDKFEMILFLPENKSRKGEGGLRTKGYFKKSYKKTPLISIITVVYNGEKYLKETIQSVINQTYDNVEYIIIDGGSTDGTLDIIKKYEEKIDYWLSEKDSGIYDAMNKGVTLCSGDIIGIVNADDFIYRDTLQNVAKFFSDTDAMFTFGQLDLADEDGKVFDTAKSIGIDNIKYKLFRHMPFLHPTMFVKKEVYEKLGLYNTRYKLSADYDFTLRLVKNNIQFVKLDFSTGVFRLGGQSGGMRSYLENHKLLLVHGVNPVFVYINTMVLVVKLFIRKILN